MHEPPKRRVLVYSSMRQKCTWFISSAISGAIYPAVPNTLRLRKSAMLGLGLGAPCLLICDTGGNKVNQ